MTIRVLSIDGGGMRGVYGAAYLSALERAFATRRGVSGYLDIGKAFDIIVGTSTGSIIGCGLAIGMDPREIARLYTLNGSKIFPRKMPTGIGLDLFIQLFLRPYYLRKGASALRKALETAFQGATIASVWKERKIALAVPAVNMGNAKSWVFKTPHESSSNHRDDEYTLADVCMASSAAPIFRSLEPLRDPVTNTLNVFSDGGLWANNPVVVALLESLRMSKNSKENIEIFCLGSASMPAGTIIPENRVHMGILEWKFGAAVAPLSIASQEFAFDNIARQIASLLDRQVDIVRFPAGALPADLLKYLDLDETSQEGLDALMSQARSDADYANSLIQHRQPEGLLIEALFNAMPEKSLGFSMEESNV